MKRIIQITSILLAGLLLLSGCEGMDAVYKQYKGDAPTQYLAKVQDVVVNPGFNRAKISWAPLVDARIKKVTISWGNGAGSATYDWDPGTPFEQVIEDLREGSIIFSILTFDNAGHKSVSVDVSSTIYGDSFKRLIDNSTVTNGTYDEDQNIISLSLKHSSSVYYKGMEILYKNLAGEDAVMRVNKGVNSIQITDAADLNIDYRSVFSPQEGSMEDYVGDISTYEEIKTPVFSLESDFLLLASASGCSKNVALTANRAPIRVETAEDWLTVTETNGVITVTTTQKNDAGTARTGIVSVKAKDGHADITVKQTQNRVGTAYGTEGVIWWQNKEDPTEYKILSAARGNCKWASATGSTGATAESGQSFKNGVLQDNNDILMGLGDASKYPAVWWCKNLGEGWYLPSGAELKALIEAYNGGTYTYAQLNGKKVSTLAASAEQMRNKFENAMLSIGAPKINEAARDANGDWLWSSQETNANNAYAARMGVSGYGNRSKLFDGNESSGPFYTRAMKVIHIED